MPLILVGTGAAITALRPALPPRRAAAVFLIVALPVRLRLCRRPLRRRRRRRDRPARRRRGGGRRRSGAARRAVAARDRRSARGAGRAGPARPGAGRRRAPDPLGARRRRPSRARPTSPSAACASPPTASAARSTCRCSGSPWSGSPWRSTTASGSSAWFDGLPALRAGFLAAAFAVARRARSPTTPAPCCSRSAPSTCCCLRDLPGPRRERPQPDARAGVGGEAPSAGLKAAHAVLYDSCVRVALVSPYSWTYQGGVNRHVEALAEEFLERGHHVRVLAPWDPPDRLSRWLHRADGGAARAARLPDPARPHDRAAAPMAPSPTSPHSPTG